MHLTNNIYIYCSVLVFTLTDRVGVELRAVEGVIDGLLHVQLVVQTALSVVQQNQLLGDG